MKNTKTTSLVRIALLMAITIVLAATPLGYIPAGPLSFTIMVLPVAIGGVMLDKNAGLILGLTFGITSLISAPTQAMGQLLLAQSGILTAAICIVPRVLVGFVSGLFHKIHLKNGKRPLWVYLAAGGAASFTNTALFLGLIYIFSHTLIEGAFGIAIWSSLLVGGVMELAANAFFTMVIAKALERITF